ncbi:MAG: polyphosphate kinase 1 [Chloroflexi bacterium]|nr:polyphosphate kinase 1 [Chloroflexota bacterium]
MSTSPGELQPDLYINRELSWIAFNQRVLEEAQSCRHPLLERVKFISIFETNLDEFIMIRLASVKDQIASSKTLRSPDGLTAEEQLAAIRHKLAPLIQSVRQYWRDELVPLLAEQHIYILDYEQLDEQQRVSMRTYFEREVFPVLTPLALFDPSHPFPHISNLSLNLAVVLSDETHPELFARVKVPLKPTLPRLVPVSITRDEPSAVAFTWLEQVIAAHLDMLFPGYQIQQVYPFRVLRDADIELQEDEALDLLEYIEQEVRERRFGSVVDLAINPSMPEDIRDRLLSKLELTPTEPTVIDGPLGMGDVMELLNLDRPELKDWPFIPRTPAFLNSKTDLFSLIQEHDRLVHHPYDSFNSVIDFIDAAAHDPQVLAIKQTLYRVGSNAPIVRILLKAVEKGKQVAVLVELKARFDEESNIGWARVLEEAGVHVVYGLIGLKTHAKIALVVRKEESGLRRYIHLGTGNYNASTAKIYEDFGFFTCNDAIGTDAVELFNSLTGYSHYESYRKLLVAPKRLRPRLTEFIEREMLIHERHRNGCLIFKMNSLTDPQMIALLYRASQVGVTIDLIIRGICCLRPGLPGISETIRVRSLVGRFLEHSRIYYFGNNGHEEMYLGSADLMERNLDHRVETLFPIESSQLRDLIYTKVLEPLLADTVNARELHPDGTYTHVPTPADKQPFDSQAWFMTHPLVSSDAESHTLEHTHHGQDTIHAHP